VGTGAKPGQRGVRRCTAERVPGRGERETIPTGSGKRL